MSDLIDENIKKNLTNIVSYSINKKMNSYNSKIDSIEKKIENNAKSLLFIIEFLKKIDSKIDNLNNKAPIIEKNNSVDNIVINDLNINSLDNIKIIDLENSVKQINLKNDQVLEKVSGKRSAGIRSNSLVDDSIDLLTNKYSNNMLDSSSHSSLLSPEINKVNLNTVKIVNLTDKNITLNSNQDLQKTFSEEITESDNLLSLNYKDFKSESFILDTNFVKKCLDMNNINGDIILFKRLYIDDIPKEYYPIRHIKKKFQYWRDGHMNDDDNSGTYIKNTIIKNIEQCYLRINNDDNYGNDIEQFLRNQEHINKLTEQKYKDKILSKVISIIEL
jgi:hypothetical protein